MIKKIALTGAGLMGRGLGHRLLTAGFTVKVLAHKNRAPIDYLIENGAIEVTNWADFAAGSDVILMCLSNSDVVATVIDNLRPFLKPGQIVLDMGTSSPAANIALAADLLKQDVAFAEAPLAGGPQQAMAGELGTLVGASPEVLETLRPVLQACCQHIAHFGPVGSGQTAKLVNNYMVCALMALTVDTFRLARARNIDWTKLYDVMQCGSGNSGVLQKMVGPALEGHYDGYQFSIANADKDMRYFLNMLDDSGLQSKLAETSHAIFKHAVDNDLATQYCSSLLQEENWP